MSIGGVFLEEGVSQLYLTLYLQSGILANILESNIINNSDDVDVDNHILEQIPYVPLDEWDSRYSTEKIREFFNRNYTEFREYEQYQKALNIMIEEQLNENCKYTDKLISKIMEDKTNSLTININYRDRK